jgi:predicted dehydrogenase
MKLGIIGLGHRMNSMLAQFREADPELEIVGVVDADPEKARDRLPEETRTKVSFYDSVRELVESEKPDALAIGTRCDSHTRFAIEAAPYGLPLYLEKPIATSMAQARELEATFEKSQSPVLVSFPLRTSTLCQRAKQILDQGAVGRVEHIQAVNYVSYGTVYFESWYRDHAVTQGLFLQKATHDFDYLAFLAGAPITRVAAMSSVGRVFRDSDTKGANPDPLALYYDGIGSPETGMNEDSSSALLEFGNGAKGVYTQVFFAKRSPKRGAVLSGFKGTVEFDWYENTVKTTHHREPFNDVSSVDGTDDHFGGDRILAENFVAMVRDKASPAASLASGLASVYACLAAKESAETGRFIEVRQVGEG